MFLVVNITNEKIYDNNNCNNFNSSRSWDFDLE